MTEMNRKLNIDPKKTAIRKRNIRVYNDNLRIILKEGGNYYSVNLTLNCTINSQSLL